MDAVQKFRDFLAGLDRRSPLNHELLILDLDNALKGSAVEGQGHPEDDCDACGRRNITWSAPSKIWNAVMGSPNGIVCPQCFDRRAAAHGYSGLWRFEAAKEPAAVETYETLGKQEVRKCPCNDPICKQWVVWPLFANPESASNDKAFIEDIVRRLNASQP